MTKVACLVNRVDGSAIAQRAQAFRNALSKDITAISFRRGVRVASIGLIPTSRGRHNIRAA